MHIVFLAAYSVLLHHYTRKNPIAIWGHFANRERAEIQGALGYFSNTHLLGIDLSASLTGRDLLRQVKGVVLSSCANQALPHLWRVLRCHPRFPDANILLDYYTLTPPTPQESWNGLRVADVPLPNVSSPRWSSLGVYVIDNREDIWLRSQYSAARFPHAAVQHLLEDLRSVVLRLVAHPSATVSNFADIAERYSANPHARNDRMGEFVVIGSKLIPEFKKGEQSSYSSRP